MENGYHESAGDLAQRYPGQKGSYLSYPYPCLSNSLNSLILLCLIPILTFFLYSLYPVGSANAFLAQAVKRAITLEIENRFGSVIVELQGSNPDIHYRATNPAGSVLLSEIQIARTDDADRIICQPSQSKMINLHVTAKIGMPVKIKTSAGDVLVKGWGSDLTIETDSGSVFLQVPLSELTIEFEWIGGKARYSGPPEIRMTRKKEERVIDENGQKKKIAVTRMSGKLGTLPPTVIVSGNLSLPAISINAKTRGGAISIAPMNMIDIISKLPPMPPPVKNTTNAVEKLLNRNRADKGAAPSPSLSRRPGQTSQSSVTEGSDADVVKIETLLVNLPVNATDRMGRRIGGLTAKDFEVYEDGVLQEITHFSPETAPFNLVLLLDLSGSTMLKTDLIKQATLKFIDIAKPEDRIAIIGFANDVEVISHLTGDREALRTAISN